MLRFMRLSHSIRGAARLVAIAVALTAPAARAAHAQTPSTFTVFVRSTPIGSEQVAVERTATGWTITSSGRVGPPVDLILRSFEARYDADWKPLRLQFDQTLGGQSTTLQAEVTGTDARSEVTPLGGATMIRAHIIDPRAIFLPNPFVAPWEAVSARLRTTTPGEMISIYQPAQGSFPITVGPTTVEQIKTVDHTVTAHRTRLTLTPVGAPPLDIEVWGDDNGRLLRVSVPAQGLEFAREDIASVGARIVTMSRPNDEEMRIPANGFSLAGTISKPANATGRLPAVILLGGSGPTDRDETAFGIPIFGQVANALADAGFIVLRYDKRGVGQSGGRSESARLADYAEDAKAAIKAMSDRKDVDRKRIAVVGHSEGGWIAMLASSKNDRVSAVGLIATVGVTGQELNLYQVVHGLERSGRPENEQQSTIDLQKQIQQAVVTGKGWEAINVSDSVKRQADTPYFQSFLTFDPAKYMKDVEQPLLIVQGERDMQVPPSNADQLETLAKSRKKNVPVDKIKVPGINHLLVPATTGEVEEYGRLADRQVSPAVTTALIEWLRRTGQPSR